MLWLLSLCYEILIVVLSLCFFICCYFSLLIFTRKLCLQFLGLRMRNFTWNRFPIKNLLIDSLLIPIVVNTHLNIDMCKFELSQKDESGWQSTDSLKAYRNTSAFLLSVVSGNTTPKSPTSGVRMDMEILQLDWIWNFFINSTSNLYPKIKNCGFQYQIRNRSLSCTWAKIFGSVYFAAWKKSSAYFAFSQTELVEIVTWQVWYYKKTVNKL